MSSSGVPTPGLSGFLSTHNALGHGDVVDEEVMLRATQIGTGYGDPVGTIQFTAYPFYDIEMIKRLIIRYAGLPKSTNITELRVFYHGSELPNHRSLSVFLNVRPRQADLHLFWTFRDASTAIGLRPLGLRPPPALQHILGEVNLGLQRGINPKLTMDGTGGTYMLLNSKGYRILALFKPRDEEAFAPNNPRSYEGRFGQKGFRSGVVSGEGASREIAAFLLDALYGNRAGVPRTTAVEARHPVFCYKSVIQGFGLPTLGQTFWKEGSLQEFVAARDTCGDYDPSIFAVCDVHYIGIFDMVVMNLDRNEGNMLVLCPRLDIASERTNGNHACGEDGCKTPDGKTAKYRLVPIDHGLILPDTMELEGIDFVWFDWPQTKIPFSFLVLRYILSLDPDRDAIRLRRKLGIREDCLRTMRVTARVVKLGAQHHLTLHQIASLLVRHDPTSVSQIERCIQTALAQAYTAVNASGLMTQGRLRGKGLLIDLSIPAARNAMSVVTGTSAPTGCPKLTAGSSSTREDQDGRMTSGDDDDLGYITRPRTATAAPVFAGGEDGGCGSDQEETGLSTLPWGGITRPALMGHADTGIGSLVPSESHLGQQQTDHRVEQQQQASRHQPLVSTRSVEYATTVSDADVGHRRTPLTVLRRRKTTRLPSSRPGSNSSSLWTLPDRHGKPLFVDWSDPLFERTFFECLESLIVHEISEAHPTWTEYPWHGPGLEHHMTKPFWPSAARSNRSGGNSPAALL